MKSLQSIWVLDALHRNGAVHLTLQLAERIGGQRARVVKVQSLDDGRETSVPAAVRVQSLAAGDKRLYRHLRATSRLVTLARRSDVIVNCSEIGVGLIVSAVAARLTRKPLIVAVHADLDSALQEWIAPRWHPVFYWIHRHATGAICVSADLAEPLVRNGLPRTRIRVVRNGIDVSAVQAAAGAGKAESPAILPTVIATGRVTHQKGYDILVRAHARVVPDYPHQLRIYNDGPDLEAIQSLVGELGVSQSVHFMGSAGAVLPHVARATVFCLPSRHEGLPLALLEAVALGVPCIAANCSDGVADALDSGRVGELVPVEDVDAFAQALRTHLADTGPLDAKATLGPEHAKSFDVQVMTEGWESALGELTRGG